MRHLTRRGLLQQAAAAMTVGCGALASPRPARAIPPIGRTRPSHLKLSIAAYSYRQYLTGRPPKIDLFDFVNLAADLALDGVEPTSYYFPPDVTTDYLHRLKVHAFTLGLDISGTAVGNNFCFPPGPRRDAEIAKTRLWIDRAAELDAPVIRIFAGSVPRGATEEQAVGWAIEGIKAVLPHAAQRGIVLALENHGGITGTPEQILKLVKAVDAPNFGVNLDTGNFHGNDQYDQYAQLAPYAFNVQVKTELHRGGSHDTEEADLARVIGILREARYSGYVVLEYEAAADPMKAIPKYIKTLRQLIS
ncbi:MAG TPA: sugar phosphate isomerase/epimerase family protein [Isosphaeraceae bacterium]|nr:sugar phosphate isomerase/epimerase family protein [Isosphaeraceae bacterium]